MSKNDIIIEKAVRLSRDAIAKFLQSITDHSDNYAGGVERLALEDALAACNLAMGPELNNLRLTK